ncbi:hypothetical protein QVD17_40147, partial [Tagetes erecta]
GVSIPLNFQTSFNNLQIHVYSFSKTHFNSISRSSFIANNNCNQGIWSNRLCAISIATTHSGVFCSTHILSRNRLERVTIFVSGDGSQCASI